MVDLLTYSYGANVWLIC